jgi:hypothetical protein
MNVMLHNEITDTGVCFSSDVVTKEEAIAMLKEMQPGKEEREEQMKRVGYPAYTTQAGNHNIICDCYNSVFVCLT